MTTKSKVVKKFPLYQYIWQDHYGTSSWVDESLTKPEPYIVYGVGYLVDEDKDHLVFTQGILPRNGNYNGTMHVLKSALISKKKLADLVFTQE